MLRLVLCFTVLSVAIAAAVPGVIGTPAPLPLAEAHTVTYVANGEEIQLTTSTAASTVTLATTTTVSKNLPAGFSALSTPVQYEITVSPGTAIATDFTLTSFKTRSIAAVASQKRYLLWWNTAANNFQVVAEVDSAAAEVLTATNIKLPVGTTAAAARHASLWVVTAAASVGAPHVCTVPKNAAATACPAFGHYILTQTTGTTGTSGSTPVVVYTAEGAADVTNSGNLLGKFMGTFIDITWTGTEAVQTTVISFEYDNTDAIWTSAPAIAPKGVTTDSQDFGFAKQIDNHWTRAGLNTEIVAVVGEPTKFRVQTTVSGSGRFALVSEYDTPAGAVSQTGVASGTASQDFVSGVPFEVAYGAAPSSRVLGGQFTGTAPAATKVTVTNTNTAATQVGTGPAYTDKTTSGVTVAFDPTTSRLVTTPANLVSQMLVEKASLPADLQPTTVDVRVLRASAAAAAATEATSTRRPNGDLVFAVQDQPATYTFAKRNTARQVVTAAGTGNTKSATVLANGAGWDINFGATQLQDFRCNGGGSATVTVESLTADPATTAVAAPTDYVALAVFRRITTTCNFFTTKIRESWTEAQLTAAQGGANNAAINPTTIDWARKTTTGTTTAWTVIPSTVTNTDVAKTVVTDAAVTAFSEWHLFGQRVAATNGGTPTTPTPPTAPTPPSPPSAPSDGAAVLVPLFSLLAAVLFLAF